MSVFAVVADHVAVAVAVSLDHALDFVEEAGLLRCSEFLI
jgi:hypothetical protein